MLPVLEELLGLLGSLRRAPGHGCDERANESPESAGNCNMLVPLKPMEDTHVELCALMPDGERVIMQPLVFQALLVFPSSVAEG